MTFLTVMLDVTANLLCTAIILLVLSLAMDRRDQETTRHPIAIVTGQALTPAELVAAFHQRAGTAKGAVTIDIRRESVALKPDDAPPTQPILMSRRDVTKGNLAKWLIEGKRQTVLLFVFDQDSYADVQAAVEEAGASSREIDVPLALRSATDSQEWSQGFRALFDLDLDEQAFQQRLQQVLMGGGEGREARRARAGEASGERAFDSLVDRLLRHLGFWWRFAMVLSGLVFLIWIRRIISPGRRHA